MQDSPSENYELEAILLPDWEVLLLAWPESPISALDQQYYCIFQNNATSVAESTGVLPFSKRAAFKCDVPSSVRRLSPLLSPVVSQFQEKQPSLYTQEIIRWSYVAYESLATEKDIILFVKGVNNRQGVNRPPEDLRCVFDNGVDYIAKTKVTSSSQEVFRCNHPDTADLRGLLAGGDGRIRISIEIQGEKRIFVPSVTYYEPKRNVEYEDEGKAILCASTMVHNIAKFLREWVVYHSKLGVEKFILYDNDSDDELQKVVQDLSDEEYNVKTVFWPWPKTQEAGFSHSAVYAKDKCAWMMYMDVDEFVFTPPWLNNSKPSPDMLTSILPALSPPSSDWLSRPTGQLSVRCLEFGPSDQQSHPTAGVTQGYTCRRRSENRHKSIVLLDVIADTLRNVIHHFELKDGYRTQTLSLQKGVVNHYKYQAWSEFKSKFKRRVSAYVVDWRRAVNPASQDRTPGLGYEAVEPEGWAKKFCEVNDTRLKKATQRWFSLGSDSTDRSKMVWQK